MIKLAWSYENGDDKHKIGDEVTLTKAEEKELVEGGYAVFVEEPAKPTAKVDEKPKAAKAGDKGES